ncbi:hypothetical protein L211DRAFT_896029 [Terfezia boudieri ATCC MYA-4762]|uniref:Uncharacterized protein n=1 Tax=Terfezia boudieri ATCC MYA-4762 TaxID=1051890 RepID=A0A3N4LAT7_9PEZI|nr:hypothetical protein L211DRAFT_896029 [Terfezia boudieri ATCC MYA-4762]
MSGRHYQVRKRRHILPRPTDNILPQSATRLLPQLRPLAPKSSCHPVSSGQHRLQLKHNNIRDELDSKAPLATTTNIKPKHPPTSRPLDPVCSYDLELPSIFPSINSMASNHERKQCVALTPCTNIWSNRMPLTSVDFSFPELVSGNEFLGVTTHEHHYPSTHLLPYSNVQFQSTLGNSNGGDYCNPSHSVPEDAFLTAITQPTIGIHQSGCSAHFWTQCNFMQGENESVDQHSPVSIQQLPPSQIAYHEPVQQNSQQVACPPVWRSHLESIMFSDPEDKGISKLKHSYRDLQQHINEAHKWQSGAACATCENLFCSHLDKMMLLEAAKGDISEVKDFLRRSFKALRDHIQDAHRGC